MKRLRKSSSKLLFGFMTKELKKLDKAVTDFVLKHPEVTEEATALMDAACRVSGIDPEEERRKVAMDSVLPRLPW